MIVFEIHRMWLETDVIEKFDRKLANEKYFWKKC